MCVFFCNCTQRRIVVCYRRFGITYQFHLISYSSWTDYSLKTGLIGCPRAFVTNFQHTLPNISEEPRPQALLVFCSFFVVWGYFKNLVWFRLQIKMEGKRRC